MDGCSVKGSTGCPRLGGHRCRLRGRQLRPVCATRGQTDTGRRFVNDFGATQPGGIVTLDALYAAQATEVLLDAIARSDGSRASVTNTLLATTIEEG